MLYQHRPLPLLDADPDVIAARLYLRWYRLRQLGVAIGWQLVPPLLQDGARLWTYDNAIDPWGSKSPLSYDQLKCIVEIAESKVARTLPDRLDGLGIVDKDQDKNKEVVYAGEREGEWGETRGDRPKRIGPQSADTSDPRSSADAVGTKARDKGVA